MITKELDDAGISDVSDAARPLPPRFGMRTSLTPVVNGGHISGGKVVPLFADGSSTGAASVCVTATNAPQIPVSYFLDAFGRMAPQRLSVVVGPTHRGGWYLLGASGRFPYPLLKDISDGAFNLLTDTQKRAIAGELSIYLLPSLQSLETPDDGWRILRDMRRGVAAAPRTQYTLRKLRLE